MNESLRKFHLSGEKARNEVENFITQTPMDRQRAVVRQYLDESENYRVNILQTIRTFESLSHDQLRFGAQSMEDVFYKKGEVIIQQEDIGDSFFIVEKGTVSVTKKNNVKDPDEQPKELVRLGADSYFGHLALVTDEPRSATITAVSDVVKCLTMNKAIFQSIRDQSEALSALGREKIGLEVLKNLPNFQNLTLSVRKDLLKAMKSVPFPANTYICRQGSVGNTFYVITEGKCRVTLTEENGGEKEIRTFFPGDYFGETALIMADSIRTVNVISSGYVLCLCLSRADFSTLLSSAASAIMEQSLNRQKDTEEKKKKKKDKRQRRRISGFDNNNIKQASMTAILFHRLGKFMSQSLFLSMYWKMYRSMVLVPHNVGKYGPIAKDIMDKYGGDEEHDRLNATVAIQKAAKEILHKPPLERTEHEHSFIIGLLSQPNQLKSRWCQEWPDYKYEALCRKLVFRRGVEALRKVNDVGEWGSTTLLILRGCVRLHAHYHDDKTNRPHLVYEEDAKSGELVHTAALGGMDRRLLSVTAISDVEFAEIEYHDYLDAKGTDVYTLSTDEKYRLLSNVPLFREWEPYALYLVAQELQHQDCSAGTKLLTTGKYSDKLFFLLHGEIDILSNVNRTSTMATLQKYEYFGESSVLNHFFADEYALGQGHAQTKRERRLIRNGKNRKHPSVFYELTDAVTKSHVELLVLPKEYFALINASTAESMRKQYYKRAQARLIRSKMLYQEDKKAGELKKNFELVAKQAMQEDDPDQYYRMMIPNEYEEKRMLSDSIQYPKAEPKSSAKTTQPVPTKWRAETSSTGAGTVGDGSGDMLSHGTMHNSAQQASLHLSSKPVGLIHEIDSYLMGSFRALGTPGTPGAASGGLGLFPAVPGSPARPGTTGGTLRRSNTSSSSLGGGHTPSEVKDLEDIPLAINGGFNPVGLLGTCKTDKQRKKALHVLQSTYKVRSASEMHSRIGVHEKGDRSRLTRAVSSGSLRRPATADGTAGDPYEVSRLTDYLRGSHSIHAGKHFHETLSPEEKIRFRPSTNRTKTRKISGI